ncbi:outer membrane protein with beta-barrel domain [Flavobacterium croceum DSM 17960]|uniref:Outer membrane protein with beta-barrel domain n=1 Tax=Flavobacterium croceum DSM 17960 TaxID=1121886 RepID=A0A2S4N6Z1_9FLAO|nr:porin family protein [Flavobacterium croceum]POS01488.1 outer membrane protein with beta-barrel domain [Flavobacterium croceum DSM 17960]
MKKIFLFFTLSLSFFTFSQNSKIKFGFQTGLNYSNFRGYNIPASFNQVYSESPAFAYLGGFNFEYQFKEKLSLKLELNYERKSQKGDNNIEIRQSFDEPAQAYNFTTKRNYDYLVLPILLKYSFTNKNSFYVNGGPFIGYLLKSKFTNNFNVAGFNSSDLETTKDNKKTDFGLSFGLGKNFELSNNKTINLEMRENLGLINTSKIDVWNGGTVKTNSINLIVGISFN